MLLTKASPSSSVPNPIPSHPLTLVVILLSLILSKGSFPIAPKHAVKPSPIPLSSLQHNLLKELSLTCHFWFFSFYSLLNPLQSNFCLFPLLHWNIPLSSSLMTYPLLNPTVSSHFSYTLWSEPALPVSFFFFLSEYFSSFILLANVLSMYF